MLFCSVLVVLAVLHICACVYLLYRRGSFGMMPHHLAALEGHVNCLKNVIGAVTDFDINATDNYGRTCLHCGACGGYVT